MAPEEHGMQDEQRHAREGVGPTGTPMGEASVRDLIGDLASETSNLIRQEANLAKLEMRQTASAMVRDFLQIGIAAGIAVVGLLVFAAFLVIGLGILLGNVYWASSLIVAALLLLVGGLLAQRAIKDMKQQDLAPQQTQETLHEDQDFAKRKAKEIRDDLKH